MSIRPALPALAAALLFGASTPFAKLLVGDLPPLLLAGLLYLGSGAGLGLLLLVRRARQAASAASSEPLRIPRPEWPWLAGAIFFGGVLGPALLDNNLTRKVSTNDAMLVACLKGLLAGACNTGLALASGAHLPSIGPLAGSLAVGFLGYGLSLTLFVVGLRTLGTARTGAYFSVAPLFGVLLSLAIWPALPPASFWAAAGLMALGVWLHVKERHEHEHTHEPMEHSHRHVHDEHHQHEHDFEWDGKEPHVHPHRHEALTHRHPHYPDIHHRHGHG